MATKGVNPFAKFEKSGKDVEKKGMKEGSKKEMMMDKTQMMKKGGLAAAHKAADGIAKKGKTQGMQIAMKKGGMARGR